MSADFLIYYVITPSASAPPDATAAVILDPEEDPSPPYYSCDPLRPETHRLSPEAPTPCASTIGNDFSRDDNSVEGCDINELWFSSIPARVSSIDAEGIQYFQQGLMGAPPYALSDPDLEKRHQQTDLSKWLLKRSAHAPRSSDDTTPGNGQLRWQCHRCEQSCYLSDHSIQQDVLCKNCKHSLCWDCAAPLSIISLYLSYPVLRSVLGPQSGAVETASNLQQKTVLSRLFVEKAPVVKCNTLYQNLGVLQSHGTQLQHPESSCETVSSTQSTRLCARSPGAAHITRMKAQDEECFHDDFELLARTPSRTSNVDLDLQMQSYLMLEQTFPGHAWSDSDGEKEFVGQIRTEEEYTAWPAGSINMVDEELLVSIVKARVSEYRLHFQAHRNSIRQCANAGSSAGSTDRTNVSSVTQATAATKATSKFSPASKKRPPLVNDEDPEQEGNPSKRAKISKEDVQKPLFACPFWVFDEARYSGQNIRETCYRRCACSCLVTISRLKQHLYRVHRRPEFYCLRCFLDFPEHDELELHSREQPQCDVRHCPFEEKMSHGQAKTIQRRRNTSKNPSVEWYFIYQTLFPNSERPATPYMGVISSDQVSHAEAWLVEQQSLAPAREQFTNEFAHRCNDAELQIFVDTLLDRFLSTLLRNTGSQVRVNPATDRSLPSPNRSGSAVRSWLAIPQPSGGHYSRSSSISTIHDPVLSSIPEDLENSYIDTGQASPYSPGYNGDNGVEMRHTGDHLQLLTQPESQMFPTELLDGFSLPEFVIDPFSEFTRDGDHDTTANDATQQQHP